MRVPTIALIGVALVAALLPASASAQAPPTAALDDAGRLSLDFRVDRFVVRDGRLAARGVATARLSGPGDTTRTVRQRVTAPARIAQARARRCSVISLSLAPLQLDVLGLRVATSEINLRIRGVRRGAGSGVLGRLVCSLVGTRVNASSASARAAARALNAELPRSGLRTVTATATLRPQAVTAQQASCQILFLQLGPLELNVLGLLIELFGETRGDPVTLTITAFRGQGLLGDLLCSVASTPLPTP